MRGARAGGTSRRWRRERIPGPVCRSSRRAKCVQQFLVLPPSASRRPSPNRDAATSKRRAPTNCADATSTDPETTSEGSSSQALLQAVGSSATDTTDDPSRRTIACKTFASPLRALAPLLLRGEDPALVEIVVEQRRRQRVASQKCRLVLRDGIDRTTRDVEAFRTQKTAAPWLMRPTGTAK